MIQEVLYTFPPNFKEIAKVFPKAIDKNVLFSYGDKLYSPGATFIPQWIYDHERVHGERQLARGVQEWWACYLADPVFMLSEELLAHQEEYKSYKVHGTSDRNLQEKYLDHIAHRLSGPLYNKMLSFATAKKLIKEGGTIDPSSISSAYTAVHT